MNARGLIAGARNNAFVQKKVPAACSGTPWPLLLGPIDQENNDADWRFACLGLEPGPFQTPRSGTAPGCGSHALQSWNSLKKIRKQWMAVTRALEPYGRSGADEVWSRSAPRRAQSLYCANQPRPPQLGYLSIQIAAFLLHCHMLPVNYRKRTGGHLLQCKWAGLFSGRVPDLDHSARRA